MALSTAYPTARQVTAQYGPDNKIRRLVEMLDQTNEVLRDAPWREGNLPTGHQDNLRTRLPSPTWRELNGGVPSTTGDAEKIIIQCGMLADAAVIDRKQVELNGNSAAWMMNENKAHIEGISQALASTIFYGNTDVNSERFNGFSRYFNTQSGEHARNILTSATTPDGTDNASIWIVNWGATVFLCYPKGSQAGIRVENEGLVTVESAPNGGGMMKAYRMYYEVDCALVITDWRDVVRINIDLEDVVAAGGSGPVIADLLGKGLRRLQGRMGNKAIYCNTDVLDAMDLQANNKATLAFSNSEDADGRMVTKFRGVPVRQVDALLSTEAGL